MIEATLLKTAGPAEILNDLIISGRAARVPNELLRMSLSEIRKDGHNHGIAAASLAITTRINRLDAWARYGPDLLADNGTALSPTKAEARLHDAVGRDPDWNAQLNLHSYRVCMGPELATMPLKVLNVKRAELVTTFLADGIDLRDAVCSRFFIEAIFEEHPLVQNSPERAAELLDFFDVDQAIKDVMLTTRAYADRFPNMVRSDAQRDGNDRLFDETLEIIDYDVRYLAQDLLMRSRHVTWAMDQALTPEPTQVFQIVRSPSLGIL